MRIARGISIANISKPISTEEAFDADAVAFFTAANITNTTQKSAVNTLVLSLKSANIWTKMKAIYPVVGGVSSAHAINLKSPGTYNLTFQTGWNHTSTGMTPLNTFANTALNPSTALTLNNTHLSYYSRTDINTAAACEIGCGTSDTQGSYLLTRNSNLTYIKINSGITTPSSYSDTNSLGLYLASRLNSTNQVGYKNGISKLNNNANSNLLTNLNVSLASYNRGGTNVYPSTKQCAFASIGDGLTDAEVLSFYNAVQTFQTTLGRQV